MKPVLIMLMIITTANAITADDVYTDHGPDRYKQLNGSTVVTNVTVCTNETEIEDVNNILDEYVLTRTRESRVFDCSNIAEIDWYILERAGKDCDIAANGGKLNGKDMGHVFVWVKTETGIIVVDSTYGATSQYGIGGTIEPGEFYTNAWVYDSPKDVVESYRDERPGMTGITLDTPIEELPIRRKAAC